MIINGDCLKELEKFPENSIDAIVTDPPYELGFMGKDWDNAGVSFSKETWVKCLRVLKPGGYLLAFGGSRTQHRIACAIEDAGFEIRDTIMWLYGSGFPKSLNISKQIDKRSNRSYENLSLFGKKLKEQRELKGYSKNDIDKIMGTNTAYAWWEGRNYLGDFRIQLPNKENYKKLKEILELNDDMDFIFEEAEREVIGTTITNKTVYQNIGDKNISGEVDITIPSTDLAKQWQGWGTALKPSYEPIIVARKPFKGSCVNNVMKWGVGGINIDECRVETTEINRKGGATTNGNLGWKPSSKTYNNGRFPANTILDTQEGEEWRRYFYCAKASKKDRDEGLDSFSQEKVNDGRQTPIDNPFQRGETPRRNIHPTVKPTTLMQYLIRMVSPKNATILDPFMGSGSTGKAVAYENKERNANYKFIGIELDEEYCEIAKARINFVYNKYEKGAENEQQSL